MTTSLEKTERVNLLCDAYAELLTPRQQELLTLYFGEDYSLTEIAELQGISRQAVHEALQRAVQSLEQFELKLELVAKNQKRLALCADLQADLDRIWNQTEVTSEFRKRIAALLSDLCNC